MSRPHLTLVGRAPSCSGVSCAGDGGPARAEWLVLSGDAGGDAPSCTPCVLTRIASLLVGGKGFALRRASPDEADPATGLPLIRLAVDRVAHDSPAVRVYRDAVCALCRSDERAPLSTFCAACLNRVRGDGAR